MSVRQLAASEINPCAFELAQGSVQIGFLRWGRDHGCENGGSPVLQNLDGFRNEAALLVVRFRRTAKALRQAQVGEHPGSQGPGASVARLGQFQLVELREQTEPAGVVAAEEQVVVTLDLAGVGAVGERDLDVGRAASGWRHRV